MLGQEQTELILNLYLQFFESKQNSKIEASDSAQLQWSAIALRQTQNNQHPNKMYMKVETNHKQNNNMSNKTVNMTLVEFRLLAEDVNKA